MLKEFLHDAVLMNTGEVIIRTLQGEGCEKKVSHAGFGRILNSLHALPGKDLVTIKKRKEIKWNRCLAFHPLKTDITDCEKHKDREKHRQNENPESHKNFALASS